MRFSIIQERPNSPFVFQLLSNQDQVLLTSDSYTTREACTDGIRETISALRDPESFGIQAGNAISLRSSNGGQLASSGPLASRQTATETIADIVAAAAQNSRFDVSFTTSTSTATQSRQRAFQRVSPEELASLYNFARTSSGAQGFELYREDDELFYFHFNDANSQPLLFGRGFSAAAKRDRRVEAVIKNAGIEKRYEIVEENGEFYITLKARNGQEIARSRRLNSRTDAEQQIAFLIGSVPSYADQYIKKRKARAQSASNVYLFDQLSTSGEVGFESFRNPETKQHFFHFNDDQGQALLFSQGYSSPKGRDNGIRSVIKNAVIPERFESKEHNGKYYFVLRAGNRQEIAQSRFFASAAERDRWITYFLGSIGGYATAYGVTLASAQTTTETESFTLDAPPAAVASGLAGAAGLAAAASSGDGDKTADIPEPAPATPEPEVRRVAEKVKEEEEAYAYAGDDDGGGLRLWIPWIIGLIAAALILFWLLSMLDGCGGNSNTIAGAEGDAQQEIVDAGPAEAAAETPPPPAETSAVTAGSGSTGEPAPFGPAAAALGFAANSLEGRMANLLSAPDRTLPATFVLDQVSFPRHSAKLNKSAYDQVDNLAKLLKAYPDLKINFIGHIDGTEDDNIARAFMKGENITLSAVRARCLYQKFIESGINESQLDFEGVGASSQLVNNNTEQNKQKNRRLEVVFSSK
ncbi:MAG: DUF1508 domain-containing protein [Rhodothermales bacterium]